jgi:predicted RNA binding protein YcfA (HicA-like mRNA interferase family)
MDFAVFLQSEWQSVMSTERHRQTNPVTFTAKMCIDTHLDGAQPMPKHKAATPKEIVKALIADGWTVKRKGPGDHVQYAHPTKPGKVTVDMGVQ